MDYTALPFYGTLPPIPMVVTSGYVVQSGDSLSAIARDQLANMMRWPEIASLNNLQAPYTISPGQVLTLPAPNMADLEAVARAVAANAAADVANRLQTGAPRSTSAAATSLPPPGGVTSSPSLWVGVAAVVVAGGLLWWAFKE